LSITVVLLVNSLAKTIDLTNCHNEAKGSKGNENTTLMFKSKGLFYRANAPRIIGSGFAERCLLFHRCPRAL